MTEELNQQLNDMLTEALQLKEQVRPLIHSSFLTSHLRPSIIRTHFLSSNTSMGLRNRCSQIHTKR